MSRTYVEDISLRNFIYLLCREDFTGMYLARISSQSSAAFSTSDGSKDNITCSSSGQLVSFREASSADVADVFPRNILASHQWGLSVRK